jgi:annexin A7/11
MKGIGTDEKVIIDVLCACDCNQRQELKAKYKAMFGKDLVSDLKSELSGKLEQVVLAVMTPHYEYLVDLLHKAMAVSG